MVIATTEKNIQLNEWLTLEDAEKMTQELASKLDYKLPLLPQLVALAYEAGHIDERSEK